MIYHIGSSFLSSIYFAKLHNIVLIYLTVNFLAVKEGLIVYFIYLRSSSSHNSSSLVFIRLHREILKIRAQYCVYIFN